MIEQNVETTSSKVFRGLIENVSIVWWLLPDVEHTAELSKNIANSEYLER